MTGLALLDTSVWARLRDGRIAGAAAELLFEQLERGKLAVTEPLLLEMRYSARDARDFALLAEELDRVDVLNVNELDRVPGSHATHTAGLACAKANNAGMVGIAWGCQVDSVRSGLPTCPHSPCRPGEGNQTGGDLLSAMRRIAAAPGVGVVNMSVGVGLSGPGCFTIANQRDSGHQCRS